LREGDIISCGIEGLGAQRCIVRDEERISAG
jgi:hypothetical protein